MTETKYKNPTLTTKEKAKRTCCKCPIWCWIIMGLVAIIAVFKQPLHDILYGKILPSKCQYVDCSSKDEIPGPKLFSTRGQLDNIHQINNNYEEDLIMKIAEMADFAYHLNTTKSDKWNLEQFNNNHSVQAKHLNPYQLKKIDITHPEFGSYETVGFVAKIKTKKVGHVCVTSIRGTETMDDWIVNLNLAEGLKAPHKRGYYRAFMKKADIIHEIVLDSTRKYGTKICKHYVFTGHSQGAAVATIAAIELQDDFKKRHFDNTVNLVAFASPRVGDDRIVAKAQSLDYIFLVENRGDIVPTVPPRFLDFSHVVNTSKIEKSFLGSYHLVKNEKWDDFTDQFNLNVWNDRLKTWLSDHLEHDMDGEYLRILRKIFYEQ